MRLDHLAVVLPAFNEEEGIAGFVREIRDSVAPTAETLSIVVVDDCSTDGTARALDALAAELPELRVQRNPENRGHGPTALAAYRAGLDTGASVVVHVDGDGQFLGEDLRRVLYGIRVVDAVHGARSGRSDPWFRKLLSWLLSLAGTLLTGRRSSDVNTPLRAYRREVLERLLEQTPADSLVPHIHFTRLEWRLGVRVGAVRVRSMPRRGAQTSGTMWGPGRRSLLPSRRLMTFVRRASLEVLRTRRRR